MFIEQIIEFELRDPGPPGCTCNPKARYFYGKTKISNKNKSSSELLLTAKYIAEGNVPCFPLTWTKSITKFIQKMLGFKRELQGKGGRNNLIFSIGCQILKI